MKRLLREIGECTLCAGVLPLGPNPVVRAGTQCRIMVVGQAPGTRVHQTGIPWNDPSGDRLRDWMGLNKELFYDTRFLALVPMGFCYPGKGRGGDLPPMAACAPLWHQRLIAQMPKLALIILAGQYAHDYYLGADKGRNLAETVSRFREYLPGYMVLPHPSPRNNRWLRERPWFEQEVIPELRNRVSGLLESWREELNP